MAATEAANKPGKRSRVEKKAQATQSAALDKTKAVVRRLPPNLPEEIFWQSVQPWVTGESVSWRAFYPGKIRKKYNKENVPSRAYMAFRRTEQLAAFSQAYDGHIFRDKAGNESYAVVEFAPFQKVPSEKRKTDPRMGTIEQDEDYISFIQSLNAPTSKPSETDTLEALIAASQPPPQPKSTPLLDALRAEKQAQRDRETILKAHAHYRDQKGDIGSRRKGKQTQIASNIDQDETAAPAGQGRRNRRGKKGDPSAATTPAKGKAKDTPKVMTKVAGKPLLQHVPAASSKEAPKEAQQERRPRPAIGIGLASRQFEAALAGAGVLPAGKSRRVRERERKAGEAAQAEDVQKAEDKGEKVEKSQNPASPGKERPKGNRRRGDSAKNSAAPGTSGAIGAIETAPDKGTTSTPTILPRPGPQPGILPRPPPGSNEVPTSSGSVVKQAGSGHVGLGEGRGGRRRGRGRGTGRGVTPGGVV